MQKILFVGDGPDIRAEMKKARRFGLKPEVMHNLHADASLAEVTNHLTLMRTHPHEVIGVCYVRTRNGSTCYQALELFKRIDPAQIRVYGINIPPHPQNIKHKGMDHFASISCISEALKN